MRDEETTGDLCERKKNGSIKKTTHGETGGFEKKGVRGEGKKGANRMGFTTQERRRIGQQG